ncbi:MAG: FHA domain-containing protein [Archangium sp.]|nr:FHA domain-containing protein [Archangium sp.]MDP3155416.1 FHA domain-containing protein [Archangium sp.]MDP3573748.1 FHA domain-containing protein [Archangium sp.]
MPTLVIKNPDGSQQEQDVSGQLTIGRAEGNDLILSEGGVSRKHARFFVEGEACMVEDAGSANGTFVDGEKIEGPTRLSGKSQIVIGDYEIQLKLGSKPLPKVSKAGARPSKEPTSASGKAVKPAAPRSTRVVAAIKEKPSGGASLAKRPGPQKAAGPQLRGLTGAITGKTFSLTGTMIVGRVAGVDLVVDDDSVSRRHAELVVNGREVTVKDLGSANGTTVNGAPISEDTILAPGDIIQFGVVEVMFETGGSSGSRAPIARRGAAADPPARPVTPRGPRGPSESLDGGSEASSVPLDPRKKKIMIIAGSVLGALFLLVLIQAFTAPPDKIDNEMKDINGLPAKRPRNVPAVELDPAEQIEAYLAECRTYSSSEAGLTDWSRADTACQKVIELEPIHQEANTLVKRISVLKVCEQNFNGAKEQLAGGQIEMALDLLAKIHKGCESYLLRSLSVAKEPVAEMKKRAGVDCKNYSTNAKWDLAFKRCELYTRLACQTMSPDDLYPPALMKMKLDGPLNPKTDWRPKDPLYINFLKSREKVKPGEPMWQCPEIIAFRPPPPPPDPGKLAKEELAKRYPEPEMGRALTLYFSGDFQSAPVPLQKITEKMEKAQYHEAARALLLDINNAINLYENGTTEITNDRPEKAEVPFLKALAVDERLVLGDRAAKLTADEKKKELEKRVSFIRKAIVETMSSQSYEKGKALADRKDFRAACRIWKLGNNFSRSNIDLLKALTNVCTKRASDAFERAQSCEQLKAAMDFAVDGDGFKEKIAESMTEEGCTP